MTKKIWLENRIILYCNPCGEMLVYKKYSCSAVLLISTGQPSFKASLRGPATQLQISETLLEKKKSQICDVNFGPTNS